MMSRTARSIGWSFFAAGILLWLLVWAWSGRQGEWPRFADDAFYYFYVAENVWRGWGLSMDGVNATNGFQPLWMLVCLGIFGLPVEPTTTGIAMMQVACLALTAGIAALVWDTVHDHAGPRAAALAIAVILWPRFLHLPLSGMESAITLLVALLAFRHLVRHDVLVDPHPRWSDGGAGLLLALLVLGRLDSVWILFAVAGYVGVRRLWHGTEPLPRRVLATWWKGLAIFWPVLALVVPYLVWNLVQFGHAVPVSGLLKSSWPEIGPYLSPVLANKELMGMLGLGVVGFAAARLHGDESGFARVHGLFVAGAVAHLVHTVLFMDWAVLSGHFVTYPLVGFTGLAILVRVVHERLGQVPRLAVPVVTLLTVAGLGYSIQRGDPTFRPAAEEGAAWIVENLPDEAFLAMKDSGALSFYSQRPVMNLDGIISGLSYQEALCSGRLEEYLREAGVTHIVQHVVPDRGYGTYRQLYPCRMQGMDGFLDLPEDEERFRSTDYRAAGATTRLAVWRAPWWGASDAPHLASRE